MPLYEFTCQECTHHFETLLFNGDVAQCPKCASEKLARELSLPARPAGETTAGRNLPMSSGCDPNLPPCSPRCCRL